MPPETAVGDQLHMNRLLQKGLVDGYQVVAGLFLKHKPMVQIGNPHAVADFRLRDYICNTLNPVTSLFLTERATVDTGAQSSLCSEF